MSQPNSRIELSYTMRRLGKLTDACGGDPKNKNKKQEALVDTSKMTEFEKGQYLMALSMKNIRENIQKLDELEKEGGSTTSKAVLSNSIRKGIEEVKKEAIKVKKAAQAENKRSEYETLLSHKTKTEQLFQSRFMQDEGARAALNAAVGNKSSPKARDIKSLMDGGGEEMRPMLSIAEDEEFQLFFQGTKALDKKMDQALDRISAGVSRMHENALQIKNELKVQEVLLQETEQKVDKLNEQMYTLNGKLKKTLEEVDKDKFCVYLICCILLLAVAGLVLNALGIIKTSSN